MVGLGVLWLGAYGSLANQPRESKVLRIQTRSRIHIYIYIF